MPLKDQVKNLGVKLVEDRPTAEQLSALVRSKIPTTYKFSDDGIVPNNPRFPLLLYRSVLKSIGSFSMATVFDALFERHGWTRSWRDTVYDFVHYHSRIHEVMGIARGSAKIECGGVKGRVISVKAGDVILLPAGTGHRLIDASRNFLVVGAYPENGVYDEVTDSRDRPAAKKRIKATPRPSLDPVYGRAGPLQKLWRGETAR